MKRKLQPELLGALEEQVMLAVLRTADGAYGMSVRRELEAVTGREITIGSVYTTLDRLEAKGLVSSIRTQPGDAASRRIFSLSPLGLDSLALTRDTRERLWRGVTLQPSGKDG